MRISTNGKIEAAAALSGIGAGVAGAVLLEPALLILGALSATVAAGMQLHEAKLRKEESEASSPKDRPQHA